MTPSAFPWCGFYVDENDRPVLRTKHCYPYSYDGFVQERCGHNSEANGTIYTDRMLGHDYERTRELISKHFPDKPGDIWSGRSAAAIEGFLREWLGQPELRVILVMEYCNLASGYPYWRFDYAVPQEPIDIES